MRHIFELLRPASVCADDDVLTVRIKAYQQATTATYSNADAYVFCWLKVSVYQRRRHQCAVYGIHTGVWK
jgi:predicted HAD superfamily hydrolase